MTVTLVCSVCQTPLTTDKRLIRLFCPSCKHLFTISEKVAAVVEAVRVSA